MLSSQTVYKKILIKQFAVLSDKWASEFHDHIVNKNWAFVFCVEIEWQGQKINNNYKKKET